MRMSRRGRIRQECEQKIRRSRDFWSPDLLSSYQYSLSELPVIEPLRQLQNGRVMHGAARLVTAAVGRVDGPILRIGPQRLPAVLVVPTFRSARGKGAAALVESMITPVMVPRLDCAKLSVGPYGFFFAAHRFCAAARIFALVAAERRRFLRPIIISEG